MESPRTPISSPLPLSIFMESPHTPISSPSSLSSVTPSPRTPLCESPMMDHTPPISPRTPISSPSSDKNQSRLFRSLEKGAEDTIRG
ncbi:unnamed protein product [Trifolium pratense]|uniref:Uncharacterized protein n=1 Tax=Trifolium pratense TaxID=57577 RepID=A0ACB0K9N3_TRIPR|nr:unnamed protein product [Trifolium pratense]